MKMMAGFVEEFRVDADGMVVDPAFSSDPKATATLAEAARRAKESGDDPIAAQFAAHINGCFCCEGDFENVTEEEIRKALLTDAELVAKYPSLAGATHREDPAPLPRAPEGSESDGSQGTPEARPDRIAPASDG
jgi:hypothetical protein